jgi:hypothetical protein
LALLNLSNGGAGLPQEEAGRCISRSAWPVPAAFTLFKLFYLLVDASLEVGDEFVFWVERAQVFQMM